jgi:hypothetical protein
VYFLHGTSLERQRKYPNHRQISLTLTPTPPFFETSLLYNLWGPGGSNTEDQALSEPSAAKYLSKKEPVTHLQTLSMLYVSIGCPHSHLYTLCTLHVFHNFHHSKMYVFFKINVECILSHFLTFLSSYTPRKIT